MTSTKQRRTNHGAKKGGKNDYRPERIASTKERGRS